jgi:GT2 family glycosyltransferase
VVRIGAEGGGAGPVAVVVVTWNSESVLSGLLDSLALGMRGVDWHLVIVDNCSTDGTLRLAQGHPAGARVESMKRNAGFAAALNHGLAGIEPGSAALVLNPDLRLLPDCAARLLARLDPPVGIVAPRLEDESGALLPSLRFEPSVTRALAETILGVRRSGSRGWGETVLDQSAYSRPTIADWATGAALMVSRDCLGDCGPWEESFFLYSEDAEYELRARDHGFLTCLVPEAGAIHLGGESRRDPRLWAMLVRNKVALYRGRHGPVSGSMFHLVSLLRELRFAATGNRPSRTAAKALVGGVRSR